MLFSVIFCFFTQNAYLLVEMSDNVKRKKNNSNKNKILLLLASQVMKSKFTHCTSLLGFGGYHLQPYLSTLMEYHDPM